MSLKTNLDAMEATREFLEAQHTLALDDDRAALADSFALVLVKLAQLVLYPDPRVAFDAFSKARSRAVAKFVRPAPAGVVSHPEFDVADDEPEAEDLDVQDRDDDEDDAEAAEMRKSLGAGIKITPSPFHENDAPLLSAGRAMRVIGRAHVAHRVGAVTAIVVEDARGNDWALWWEAGADGGFFRIAPVD